MAFTAFCDRGNTLRDPVTGQPVLVVSPGAAEALWPRELGPCWTRRLVLPPGRLEKPLTHAAPELARAFRLLPYRAVGVAQADCCWRCAATGWRWRGAVSGPVAALSPTEVGDGGDMRPCGAAR